MGLELGFSSCKIIYTSITDKYERYVIENCNDGISYIQKNPAMRDFLMSKLTLRLTGTYLQHYSYL